MKILFINKADIRGGAGITAFRLNQGLEKYFNTQNYFLVGLKESNFPNVFRTAKPGLQNFLERGINRLSNQFGLQYLWFPFSTKNIFNKVKEIKPDIINLHNIHSGYFQLSLLKDLSQLSTVVWTLHDMWSFTASAAHSFGDESWIKLKSGKRENKIFPEIGINTGSWLIKRKKEIYSRSDFTIVTPSNWLYSLAKKSPLFKNKNIIHIANGIDTEIFFPKGKKEIRKKLNIPEKATVLISGAADFSKNPFKGGEILYTILEKINAKTKEQLHIILIGKNDNEILKPFNNLIFHQTGYVFDENLIAEYLSAADVFIYPTKADNLPSALIEAIACGIPSVTFNIGGCGEIIKDNHNGFLIPPFDTGLFAEKVFLLINDKELQKSFSENGRITAEENFSIIKMSEKYFRLFQELKK